MNPETMFATESDESKHFTQPVGCVGAATRRSVTDGGGSLQRRTGTLPPRCVRLRLDAPYDVPCLPCSSAAETPILAAMMSFPG